MDGDNNNGKNEAKNKSLANQSQRQSHGALQRLNSQPTNHQHVRAAAFSLEENAVDSSAQSHESPSNMMIGDGNLPNSAPGNHRHSLSTSFTANGTQSTSFVGNAVVKASSTGTLSTPSSRCFAQVTRSDSSSSGAAYNSEFMMSFSNPTHSGALCNSPVLTLSPKAANEDLESVPMAHAGRFDFQTLSSSSPQNHDQIMHNWQDNHTCVKERLAYLHKTNAMSDIQFRVGKSPGQQLISAHKFVLAIGSAVFDALFNGRLATTDTVIDIPDVEPAAFSSLLTFLYTDDVQIGPETVMTTLYAAKKYAVPALERECVDFLKHNLSPDNAFMLLTQARLFDEPQLAVLCLETIDKNTAEALNADGFTDIDLDTLCAVLERDTLGIRECRLFAAVCRWAEAECIRQSLIPSSPNKRQVLSRALRLIRFPLMTVEEFAMGSAQSGILEDREVVELFLFFTVNPKPSTRFLDVPRCCLTGKEQVVSRFCQIESRWGYSGTSDRIRFLVNRRIFVVGFGLYGSIHGPTEYSVNVQIIHMDSTKVLGSNDPTFQCDGSTSTFRVMFKEPIEILPNTSYIACATLKGPDSYYGSKGLRKVTHESVASGKVTFQFAYAAGNNNGTSVEDGQIPEIVFYT